MDGGASERSKKSMRDACDFAGVPLVELEGGALGRAVGRLGRMAAAVTEKGFADKLIQMAIH